MRRIMVFSVTLGLLLSLIPAGLALAQDETVPTSAQVTGSGTAPVVENKWEVPDADPATPGIQYVGDDAADFVPGAQIAPNLEDLPEMQQIAYWWIGSDANGIADIIAAFVRVFHPDGSFKYQLEGTEQPCSALGNWNVPGTPLYAAYHSGQVSQADAELKVENCGKNIWVPFMAIGEISKHQPAGEYTVIATVQDQAGNTGNLSNIMQILAVVGLVIDFTGVDFGSILPNTTKWVRGDTSMTTPLLPSVKNTGNVLMYVRLHFSQMVGANYFKTITSFDAKLNTQTIDPIVASTPVCFNLEPLGSNEVGQLDLSIHPGSLLPADTYSGTLDLWGLTACP